MAPAVPRRLHPDFCNKIGTWQTWADRRMSALRHQRPSAKDALTHSPTTIVHNFDRRLGCVKCAGVGIHRG